MNHTSIESLVIEYKIRNNPLEFIVGFIVISFLFLVLIDFIIIKV